MADPCSHPLSFRATELDVATGELRERTVEVRCGSRLRSHCPSCSALYVGDARRLVRSGAAGKAPMSWLTLTAPGAATFGAVHTASSGTRRRRCGCGRYHRDDERALGTPIDPATYDYERAAGFNSDVSRLFSVLVQKLRRLTGDDLQLVRVVEYQRRGLAHIHALVRGHVDADTLQLAVRGGINPKTNRRIAATTSGGYAFGPQCDAAPVRDGRTVSAYLRKLLAYAVKGAADDLPVGSAHSAAMEAAAAGTLRCGCASDECHDGAVTVRSAGRRSERSCRRHRAARRGWGFRGHVLAASRRWGLTFGEIRRERHEHAKRFAPPSSWELIGWELLPANSLRSAAGVPDGP